MPTPLEELLGKLAPLKGFEGTVESVRAERQAPFAPAPPPPTADPYNYEEVVKSGSRDEREALVQNAGGSGIYPNEPPDLDNKIAAEYGSLRITGWDKRLEELGKEVKVEKKAGGFLGAIGSALQDIGGSPVGEAFGIVGKALDAPAEGVERMIGMAYFNEVPLNDRWKMGAWTYDSIWSDMFGGGGGGGAAAIADYEAGKSWEQIEKENNHTAGNLIGHFVLDPLWLVGGVPLVGKLPGPVAKAAGQGINFSKVPGLRNVPLVNKIGRSPVEEKLTNDIGILQDIGRPSETFATGRQNGGIRRLWERNPQAHVDDAYTHITNVTSSLTDPVLWDRGQVRDMFRALGRGTVPPGGLLGLEGTTPVKIMRRLFTDNPDLGRSIDRFESLNPISKNAFWDDARHVLKTTHNGQKTSIPELMQRGIALSPEDYQRYGSYRAVKFMEEFSQKGLPALYDIYKLEKGDLLSKADSLSGAMKTALSMFTINTPSFVVMNFVNNASTLITKLDDPAGFLNFTTHGLTSRRRAHLNAMGFTDDLISAHAEDSAFYKELAGGTEEFLRGTQQGRRLIDKALPFVKLAALTDQGLRVTAVERGIMDASAAVWKVGDGGVLEPLPEAARAIDGFEDWVNGLKFQGFGAVEDMSRKFNAMHSDELITAGGMLAAWAKAMAPQRFNEAAGQGAENLERMASFLETSFPDGALSAMDDLIVSSRDLRRGGEADYLRGLDDTVEDWKDDIFLQISDKKLADNLPPDPLPYNTARARTVTWMDAAEFTRLQQPRQELYTRLIAANNPAFGGTHAALRSQNTLRIQMEEYGKAVRDLYANAPRELSAANQRAVLRQQRDLLVARNERISERVFANNPALRKTWDDLGRAEVEQLEATMGARIAAIDAITDAPGSEAARVAWSQAIQRAHVQEATALEGTWQKMGLEYAPKYTKPEYPVAGELFESQMTDVLGFMDFFKAELPNKFRQASVLSDEQLTAMRNYIDGTPTAGSIPAQGARGTTPAAVPAGLDEAFAASKAGKSTPEQEQLIVTYLNNEKDAQRAAFQSSRSAGTGTQTAGTTGGLRESMRQRNLVAAHHGRALRDFTALNYSQKRGFDGALALMFPYHFWIGRTARDWMRLSAYRPGQTAALARLFQGVRDINDEAGLPERLRANINIPIPFVDEKIFGVSGGLYFDPIRMVYPLSSFQSIASDGPRDSDAGTRLGKVFEFGSSLGVGINPFMTLGLGSVGALGDRHAYVQRGLASVNSLPFGIPGPRVMRSALDWLAGVSEDPDPEYLTPEIKQLLANGEPLPENVLKEAFEGIVSYAAGGEFDGYRADRMVANLVGSDPERWSARDGLEALKYHRGPLWQEAVRLSKGEKGLRVLTGWGLMPMAVYPEGEKVQRGLDAIYREVRDKDDPEETSKFFEQHPEYQVRRISQLDRKDPDKQLSALDTALFYLDIDKVEQKFGQPIDLLRENVRHMEEAGYLETKEGRRLRGVVQNDIAQLTELRQAEIDQLEALYPHRDKEMSLRAAPRERALHGLREQFYAIRRDAFKSDEEFYAARDAFLERIPIEGADPGEWMQAAVRSIAIWNQASDEAGARPALAGEIIQARDQRLRELTEQNTARISREDFQRYLGQGGKPPTANAIEYDQAKTEMASYFAIAEAPGLTEDTKKAYRKEFWKAHPLLEKYYGKDEPKAWNAESAFTYGRMDQIWEGYYAVEDDVRAQRDYLAGQLPELNELRRSVGLYPLRVLDFHAFEGGVFGRPSTPAPRE